MDKVIFDSDACKGCELCVAVCPKGIVAMDTAHINKKGYHPAHCIDQEKCIACAFCARMCPDCVITVQK